MACYIDPKCTQYRRDDNHINKSDEQIIHLILNTENLLEFNQLYFELTVRQYDFSKNIDLVHLYYKKHNDIIEVEDIHTEKGGYRWYVSNIIISHLIKFDRPKSYRSIMSGKFSSTLFQLAIKYKHRFDVCDFINIITTKNTKNELWNWDCDIEKIMTLMVSQDVLNRNTDDNNKLMDFIFSDLCIRSDKFEIIKMIYPAYIPTYEDHWMYITNALQTKIEFTNKTHLTMIALSHGLNITNEQRLNLACLYDECDIVKALLYDGVCVCSEIVDILLNAYIKHSSKRKYSLEILTLLSNYKHIHYISVDVVKKLYNVIYKDCSYINNSDQYEVACKKIAFYNSVKISTRELHQYNTYDITYLLLWIYATKMNGLYELVRYMMANRIEFHFDRTLITQFLINAESRISDVKHMFSLVPQLSYYINRQYINELRVKGVYASILEYIEQYI